MNQLSPHFSLLELTKSSTAARLGIVNEPDEAHIENLERLATQILEPVRKAFASPVIVTSGYRSPELCTAIGSKPTSQHAKGEAADFEIIGVSNPEIARFISLDLSFDQLILEHYNPDEGPNSGWIHCSVREVGKNRRQTLTIGKSGTQPGLIE